MWQLLKVKVPGNERMSNWLTVRAGALRGALTWAREFNPVGAGEEPKNLLC